MADGPSNELVRKDQVWLKIEHLPTRISIVFQKKHFSLWKSLSRKKGRDTKPRPAVWHNRHHFGVGVTLPPPASAFGSPGARSYTLGHQMTTCSTGSLCTWCCRKDGEIRSFLNHRSLDESQQTSLLVFAFYSFRKSRAIGNFLPPLANLVICKVLFSKWSACFVTWGIYRWNPSEGSTLSINNPTATKRNAHISEGPFLLSGQGWSFECAPQTNRAIRACLGLNWGVYHPTQWFLFHMRLLIMKRNLPHPIVIMKCSFV